jgi:predicted signal transduction protein with EAL and GGDEF domain
MRTSLDRVARCEWRLWFSAIVTTLLAGAVLVLSVFHRLFTSTAHFYDVSALQSRDAAFELLLLFNAWMLYRLWSFRRAGRELRTMQFSGDAQATVPQDSFRIDPATGLCTRVSFEFLLGKEVARSRCRKSSLSLVAIQLDDFAQLSQRLGPAASDAVAKEFASRLRRASRGAYSTFCSGRQNAVRGAGELEWARLNPSELSSRGRATSGLQEH